MSIVMKFGGTSLADAAAFENVVCIVAAERGASPVVVVSAMSGVTDGLLSATPSTLGPIFDRHLAVAKELQADQFAEAVKRAEGQVRELLGAIEQTPSKRKILQDTVVSFGEILSSALLAEVLNQRGIVAQQVDGRRCIITDDEHTSAAPLLNETFSHTRNELGPLVEARVVPVLGGYIGATLDGTTTTLGRGGSDYSGALVGAGVDALEIQIWTDVDGMLTAHPRLIKEPKLVPRLSVSEAAQLAYFGAQELHP